MAPRKSPKDPKQPSIMGFVTPSKKRREPDARANSVSPAKRARRSAPESNNNNNNNNNNQDTKKEKAKKKSDNKENASSQRNSSSPVSPSKNKKALPATTPKRRTRKPKVEAVESVAASDEVAGNAQEQEPEEILGISEHGGSSLRSGHNRTVQHGDIIDGIIDHGEEPEEEEVEELQRMVDAADSAPVQDNDVIAEDSDDDYSGVVNSNGVVELSPTTATVVSPSGSSLIGSPEFGDGSTTVQLVPSDTTPEKKVQVFKCKKCDQIFRNRYYMRKHMLMDHEHQLYKCRICAFTSVFPEKLKSHIIKQHVCKKEKSEALTVQTLKNENEVFEQQAPRKIIMIDGVPLGKVKKVPQCYICDVCGKVYSSKFSLERHVRCHTGERPYQCDVCDFTTSYREHMQRHMTSVHLVVHSDEPRMKYVPKNKRSKEEIEKEASALEEESRQTSPDGSPSKKRRNILRKRFECAACGMRATHKSDLVEHIKEKHPKAHIVSLDNNDGSKVHLVVTASKKPREARKFTATCSYCSKVFHDNWKYMVHLRSHTGVKPFSCSECDFHATTKMTVRDHIHRKHADCPEAKLILKLVNITDGSVEEVAIDVPQKEFKCELCFQVFPGNYELKTHKFKDHPEAKPFSCTMCDQKEWGKAAIIIHCSEAHPDFELETIILRNNRPTKIGPINLPKCDTCSKMFPYQSLLYLHQRTHTGERNYGCDSCDFRTDSKKALTRHILKKHLDSNLKVKPKKPKKKITKDIAIGTEDDAPVAEEDAAGGPDGDLQEVSDADE